VECLCHVGNVVSGNILLPLLKPVNFVFSL
jgi:hypothetical protein